MDYVKEIETAQIAESTASATLHELSQRVREATVELNEATRSAHTRRTLRQVALASGDPLPEDAPVQSVLDLQDTLAGLHALIKKTEAEQREAQARLKGLRHHALRAIQADMEREYGDLATKLTVLWDGLSAIEQQTGEVSLGLGKMRMYVPGLRNLMASNGEYPGTNPHSPRPGAGAVEVTRRLKEKGL